MKKYLILFIVLFISSLTFSQKKKKEKLETEEITVVKSFAPTVSDAFKINTEPKIDTSDISSKIELNYTLKTVPVASTFIPAKGKARAIQKEPRERFYQNFASVGYGNFNTPIVELFAHYNTSNYNDFGGFINYHSSGGGIDEVKLNDNFMKFSTDLYYKQTERYFEWQAKAGFKYLSNNWYGLSDEIIFSNNTIKSIDEKQNYMDVYFGGDIEFFDALVHKGNITISRFSDKMKSIENYGVLSGTVDFPVGKELIYTVISLEFLNGHFEHNYAKDNSINYTFFNLGFSPNFEILRDNLSINLGANLYYSMTDSDVGSKFYAYPNITAAYNFSNRAFIAYAGVIGDLTQNSYKNFAKENPFVSPTLNIERTSEQYNAYAGIKGLITNNIHFNIKAAYGSEKDKALFKLNPSKTNGNTSVEKGYEAANSFQIVYDDVNTIKVDGEVIVDWNKEFKFGGNIEFNSYNLDTQAEAWNLPMIKATLLTKYIRKKWNVGADIFFASDRKDDLIIEEPYSIIRITNKSYFDININGLYNLNDKFSIFLNLNNILNSNYQEYSNFKVQGFQVFGGVKYKFDL
jgi:hypothetical protein